MTPSKKPFSNLMRVDFKTSENRKCFENIVLVFFRYKSIEAISRKLFRSHTAQIFEYNPTKVEKSRFFKNGKETHF